MGAENYGRVIRYIIKFFNKTRPQPSQPIHHKTIVYDLMTNINRRTE